MPDIIDAVVVTTAKISGLARRVSDTGSSQEVTDESNEDESKQPKMNKWALDFGKSRKSQLAALIMFNVVHNFGKSLKKSWDYVSTGFGSPYS